MRGLRPIQSLKVPILGLLLGSAVMLILPSSPGHAQTVRGGTTPKIENMYDLCRMRERVIIAHSKAIVTQTVSYLDERDTRKRPAMLAAIEAEQKLLADVELSWQRLGCVDLLYGEGGRAPR